nr:enoyl-CoA hydratase-related protein [Rhizobium ruizarguesonis]
MTLVASLNSLQTIIYEKKGATAFVTLNRPAVLNALNQLAIAELRIAFEDIQNDPAIRGAILTGSSDRAFVAGADIAELSSSTPVDAVRRTRAGQDLFNLRPAIAIQNDSTNRAIASRDARVWKMLPLFLGEPCVQPRASAASLSPKTERHHITGAFRCIASSSTNASRY